MLWDLWHDAKVLGYDLKVLGHDVNPDGEFGVGGGSI